MSQAHSDAEAILASQIAYLNVEVGNDNKNIGDIVDNILYTYGYQDENGNWNLKEDCKDNKVLEEQFHAAKGILEIAEESGIQENDWRQWEVVNVCDDQDDSGYYGMLISTGDGNAVVASRGSEMTDMDTAMKDWAQTNANLLDGNTTKQHERAEKYIEELYYKYGEEYDSYTVTGHSLGGNLATHMTLTAPLGMRDKIDRCVNLDGPGYSDEYIDKHKEDIEKMGNKIEHNQWSIVGSLLTPIPGSSYKSISADKTGMEQELTFNTMMDDFTKHSLTNVSFNENGETMECEKAATYQSISDMTQQLDNMTLKQTRMMTEYAFSPKGFQDMGLVSLAVGLVGLAKMLINGIRQLKDIGSIISNAWSNIYYNYIAPDVEDRFEVNLQAVTAMSEEIYSMEKSLSNITDEIDNLKRNLKYWSTSGAYYRSCINSVKNGLENDIKKLTKLREAATNAVYLYGKADNYVADLF